jgi:catechol 2,3-dioxygenase-like lactoylglutathione lyase family enzyme
MTTATISTVTVPVADQDAALAFYTGALGMRVVTDDAMPMGRWLTVAPAGSSTTLLLASWFPGAAPVFGLVLTAPDLDALAAGLKEHHAGVEGPSDEPWGRQLTFTDPDGNGFVAVQAPGRSVP